MRNLLLLSFLGLSFSFGCATRDDDLVEEQREEIGVEDEGFYDDRGLYDDADELYEDPGLVD